jgi:hypothetical protein
MEEREGREDMKGKKGRGYRREGEGSWWREGEKAAPTG